MSVIDNKIVQMVFDNSKFNSNVESSQTVLEKFKSGLNFEGVANALNGITQAASKVDFSSSEIAATHAGFHISDVFEKVTRFLENDIARRIVDVGKNVLKEFTIDPVKTGFSEFELKMGSIQTIMAGTGESLDTVNKYLDELNTYSDKTIYSFSDMTSNIGKFTNAGVKLEDAVAAIKGVSNEAALSGANAQEASRAMYNFAQALSAGYVKLIDWKSIENANMATVSFKEELIKTAVELGTLVEKEDMFVSTTTDANGKVSEAFDATHMFNDSLSNQWMTTEVLTKTLAKYADETTDLGKRAYAAAQDVKTFSMMMDTLKEAAQSGWSQSWELIVGDFEQGKTLWTMFAEKFGEIIEASSEARNAVLKEWATLGGRDTMVNALKGVIDAVVDIFDTLGDAWGQVFGQIDGFDLVKLTIGFRDFVKAIKPSEEALGTLSDIFVTFFNVVKTGKKGIEALSWALEPLGELFSYFKDLLVDAIYWFMPWINGTANAIESNDTFKKNLSGLRDTVQKVVDKIKEFFDSVKEKIKAQGFEDFGDVVDKIKEKLETVKQKFDEFKAKVSEKIGFDSIKQDLEEQGITGIGDIFEKIAEAVKGAIEKVKSFKQTLSDLFRGAKEKFDFSGVTDIFSGIGKILETIWKIVKDVVGYIGEAIGGLNETKDFSTLISNITSFVMSLAGLNFAKGISNFGDSLTGLGDALKGFLGGGGDGGGFGDQLKDIAEGVIILVGALAILASLDTKAVNEGVLALGGLFAMLNTTMGMMGGLGKDSTGLKGTLEGLGASISFGKVASGLEKLAIAVGILAASMVAISSIDEGKLMSSWIAVSALLLELVGVSKLMEGEKGFKNGLGLVEVSAAVLILSDAVTKLGALPISAAIQGVVGIGLILGELAGFTKLTGGTGGMVGLGLGMIEIGAAMLIFANALGQFGSMPLAEIGKGLLAMGGVLTELAIALNLMPGGATMVGIGLGLVEVGAAIAIIVPAFERLGDMSLVEIGKGLLALGAALAELVVALNLMNGALAGSAALLVAAGAIAVLVPAFKGLASLNLVQIAAGTLALASALGVIVVAGALAQTCAVGLLSLSAAVIAFGVAVLGIGAGLALFGVGLTTIATGLQALALIGPNVLGSVVNVIVGIVEAVAGLIPTIIEKIGEGFVLLIELIISNIPALLDAVGQIILGLVTFLSENGETIVAGLMEFLALVLQHVTEFVPQIVELVMTMILDILTGIEESLPDIIQKGVDIIIALMEGVQSSANQLIEAGMKVILDFINGLAESIRTNTPLMIEAVDNLISAVIEAIALWFTHFVEKGAEIVEKIVDGIFGDGTFKNVTGAIGSMLSTAIAKIGEKYEEFKSAAKNLIEGFIEGIKAKATAVWEAVTDTVEDAIEGVKDFLGIASPSKLMRKLGDYTMQGFARGIEDDADMVSGSMSKVVDASLTPMKTFGDTLRGIIDENLDLDPTITPRLDLSMLRNGFNAVDSMFSKNFSISGTPEEGQNGGLRANGGFSFVQNNYSPKALSRTEIYRQTKNQFAMMKEVVNGI